MPNNTKLVFHKMHGLGNDFMLLDGSAQQIDVSKEQIDEWADRNCGIGFDQLIMIQQVDDVWSYRFNNADGSEAEQCGNGQRCIAKYLAEKKGVKLPIRIKGKGGWVSLDTSEHGYEATFTSVNTYQRIKNWPIEGSDSVFVDMGNPHLVMSVQAIKQVDLIQLKALVDTRYPAGINIEVIEQTATNSFNMRVSERGVGETAACGSGACAAVVGAVELQLLDSNQHAQTHMTMPGGAVVVKYNADEGQVSLSGPANYVYRGEIELANE